MNKECLLKIAQDINCDYEPGLTSEINDFLERQNNISEFKLKYEQNHFKLIIKLEIFNLREVKNVFMPLVRFIEYNSTFYVRDDFDDRIEYVLLSSMKSNKGFLCNLIFEGISYS